jgi:hypothetical protein
MHVIVDVSLRWIVTVLFVVSAAECLYALLAGRRTWTQVISQALHVLMAVAMIAMAWPAGAGLPTTGPMLFFLAATLWFILIALAQAGHRGVNAYHAAMMLAMAWMYAVMSGALLPAPSEGIDQTGSAGAHHGSMPGMPGMAMPDVDPSAAQGSPPFIVGLNWLFFLGFTVAAAWWLIRLVTRRRADPDASAHQLVGIAAQAMMAAGMALMFAVMT